MGVVSGIVVYLITWWTVLFATLPFGVRGHEDRPDGTVYSAPENPNLKKKFLATTVISAILWICIYLIVTSDLISFREMARDLSEPSY